MKKRNNKKAFTLVELMVVIAILAILATVSVVGYMSFIKKANESNALAECRSELTEMQGLYAMKGEMVPDGLIFGDKKGEYFFKVEKGVLEKTDKPEGALKTELEVCDLYTSDAGQTGVVVGKGTNTVDVLEDCVTVSGLQKALGTTINNMVVKVWDDNGNLILDDPGPGTPFAKDAVSFDIYSDALSGNHEELTSAAPKTADAASNRYYTYTISGTVDGVAKSVSGIFYYVSPLATAE